MLRRFIQSVRSFFLALISDQRALNKYLKSGAAIGDAVSYSYLGEPVGFEQMLDTWDKWERLVASRGYKTFMIDDFINYGGYGVGIAHFGEKRAVGEEAILYATIYREKFLHKIAPAIDLNELLNPKDGVSKPQIGTYTLPSNKDVESPAPPYR